jgi:RsiW-degrading membrane proteinase PrsW (M82 family)
MTDQSLPMPGTGSGAAHHHHPVKALWRQSWFQVLLIGGSVWLLVSAVSGITGDPILVPSVILVGSFLAPVAVVAFALDRLHHSELTPKVIFGGFLAGGTLGVVTSAALEVYLLKSPDGKYLGVGLIEEACKAAVVMAAGGFVAVKKPRDGLVLGAIVGAGFAAFESAGYAFDTVLRHTGDHEVLDIMSTEATRALFSPFGHITWTALFGCALFSAVRDGRYRVTRSVLLTLAGVVALHAAWDSSVGVSIMVAKGLVDGTWVLTWPDTEAWVGLPTDQLLIVWQIVYDGLLILNSVIGVSWVIRDWRRNKPAAEPVGEPAAVAA